MSFEAVWDRWSNLVGTKESQLSDFVMLKEDVYKELAQSQDRDERKHLAELLATIQNKIFEFGKESTKDALTAALNGIE